FSNRKTITRPRQEIRPMSLYHRLHQGLAASILALSTLLILGAAAVAQAPTPEGQPAGMGVNTGEAHAAVLDSEHRPITAGGFVKTGPIIFKDVAKEAGLASWTHTMGTPEKNFIIETN